MSDELTPAPDEVQDTPALEAAPGEGTPAEETINWEKRFKDLQPELTKAQQEAARLRAIDEGLRNPERAPEILQEYGFSFGDDEPDLTDNDEDDAPVDPRVAAHEEWIQKQQQEAVMREFNSHLDRLAGSPDVLDDFDRQALLQESIANGFNEAATEAAFERWQQREKEREKRVVENYLKSKRTHHVSPGGTGATEVPNLDDGPTRRKWLEEQVRAAEAL